MTEPRRLAFEADQRRWLAAQFKALTTELRVPLPSEWAEANRYLPASVTSMPGPYSFGVAPYLREIVDCLREDSSVRELTWMKGAQICATTGVIENLVGYYMDAVGHAPMMLVTADQDLAQQRVDLNITPMIQASGLERLIRSTDEKNARKTGKTAKKIEWIGGGFLIPLGAQNANKLRSTSIQILLRDEIDAWPMVVGKDGDPLKLSAARTAGFEAQRKIVDLSTPTVKGQSKIEERFRRGDQRYYFVRCLGCGHPQTLRWRRNNPETGEITGIVWELDEHGTLKPDSVRYLCEACGHPHTNDDKTRLLDPGRGAEWRPTAVPADAHHRSYHLSALYSPVGMQTWASCVLHWLDAWDVEHNRARDNGRLQAFYNNVLGETFEIRGEKLRFDNVSPHRRSWYRFGEIPNKKAEQHCGSHVLVLTGAVDVHKDNLAVAVWGWCRERRPILIDYWRLEGDTEQLDNPSTWGRLRELVESHEYVADDERVYKIELTLVDSGYRADHVYQFAAEYDAGVLPVKGKEAPAKGALVKEFHPFTTPMGTRAYGVTVDMYKDRWSAALRRGWDGMGIQPPFHFNAPSNVTDKQLRELTAETKRERVEQTTKKRIGWEWHRPSGAANELWDLLVYGGAAFDIVAWDACVNQLGLEWTNFRAFYDLCTQPSNARDPKRKPFYRDP
jgi:phage terminase large subunit GpA-like protein